MNISDSYLSYFTPGQMSHETLEFILVKRQRLIERLVDRVRHSTTTAAKHQSILLGPRGMGKSHVVALVYHRVKALPELEGKVAFAWLAEEEWGVASLTDFFLVILKALAREYPDSGLQAEVAALYRLPLDQIEVAASEKIRDFCGDRTLFLLVENLEEIFRGLGEHGQWSFRSFLSQHPFVTILATTPSLFAGIRKQEHAFYGFFTETYLDELTAKEATELLAKVAERRDDKKLAKFLKTRIARERVQAVHDLAGGHPRIYLLFAHLITEQTLDELVAPFLQLLDELTPYYQSRMQLLSPQQRKIMEYLCDQRGAVAVKTIAEGNLLSHQASSAQLGELERMEYVRKTSLGRESYYELREPLLRMVIEVKRGRGEPIRLVVDFLRRWYSRSERRERLALAGSILSRLYWEASLALNYAMLDAPDLRRAKSLLLKYKTAYALGNYTRAAEISVEIIERCGREYFPAAWIQYAQCLREATDYENTLDALNKALANEPSNYASWFSRGIVLCALEDPTEALASFSKALEIKPNDSSALMAQGIVMDALSQHKEALTNFNTIVESQDNNSGFWEIRGNALIKLSRYSEALESFTKSLNISPTSSSAWLEHGKTLYELERYNDALLSFSKSLDSDSRNHITWKWKGNAFYALKKIPEALACYHKQLELIPDEYYTWVLCAHLLYEQGEYEEALVHIQEGLKTDQDEEALLLEGNILGELGRQEEAVNSYTKSLTVNPEFASAWGNRGIALYKTEQYEQALENLDKALSIDSSLSSAWVNRGFVLGTLGRQDEAISCFDIVIRTHPDNSDLLCYKAIAFGTSERHTEALACCDHAINLTPDDAFLWYYRADVLSSLQRYFDSLASYNKALEINPEYANVWFDRAKLLLIIDNWDEFIFSLKQGFSLTASHDTHQKRAEEYCSLLIARNRIVAPQQSKDLLSVFSNSLLPSLGEGITASIPALFEPNVTQVQAEAWLSTWEAAAEGQDELTVPLRLLKAAVTWKPKHDPRALLALAIEERRVLEQLLNIDTSETL